MRIGLIGCGRFGNNHAKNLATLDCKFSGISDINPDVAKIATSYNTNYFEDPSSLIERSDAVVIAAPTNLHYDLAKKALMASKHVFVEKPAAETAAETSELIEIASNQHLVLNTGYLFRFNPAVQELRTRLREAGQIRYVRATNIHDKPARKDSGVIVNLGVHPLDVLMFLTPERPLSVDCTTNGSYGSERAAVLTLDYGPYAAVIETACEANGIKDKAIEVVGEHSTLKVDFLEQTLTKYVQNQTPDLWQPSEKIDLVRAELSHFIDSMKTGKLDNLGKEDIITAKICEAAKESVIKRRRIMLVEW